MMKMILVQWLDLDATSPGTDEWADGIREDIGYEIPALFHTRGEAEAFIAHMGEWFGNKYRMVQVEVESSGVCNVPAVITSRTVIEG